MGVKQLWLVFGAPLLVSCHVLQGLDGYDTDAQSSSAGTGGSGGSGGSGGAAGSSASSGSGSCGQRPGPKMVRVRIDGGVDYCIDATEVTVSQYAYFDGLDLPTAGQESYCAWNDSFAPRLNEIDCDPEHYDPLNGPDKPVTCVDWCDAAAYCKWADKRLCGQIDGGRNDYDNPSYPGVSEWYRACSRAGERVYPYGDLYEQSFCGGEEGGSGNPVGVTAHLECVGGYAGLRGMSGNVWEWENACGAWDGPDDTCLHRGGSFWDPPGDLRCDTRSAIRSRAGFNKNVGFRCCADLP